VTAPPLGRRLSRTGQTLRRLLAGFLVIAVLSWGAGFVWFIHETTQAVVPPPPHVDGVVALTGGAGRVELALRLLATGEADKLLVTGIGGNTDLAALGRLAGMDLSPLAARITLGRYAASTQGNAVETAAWAAQNGLRSIVVVTANYHMPRALTELRQALPAVELYPLPVQSYLRGEAAEGTVAERGPSLRLQAEEYTKFLLAIAGLSPWLPHREVAASPTAGAIAGSGSSDRGTSG
jgi:uncharacterized SAM-binding protein YcdF (DUF218 family)